MTSSEQWSRTITYSTVLVPLDGSALGEQALPAAIRVARHIGALLELVHVHEPLAPARGTPELDQTLDSDVRHGMREALEALRVRLAGEHSLPVASKFLDGSVGDSLRNYILSRSAPLVVMATHGRSGLKRAVLGSVASRLVRELTVPLLLIRPDTQRVGPGTAGEFRCVLVPLDGSPEAEGALDHAIALGRPGVTEYVLLRVVPVRFAGPYSATSMGTAASLEDQHEVSKDYLTALADRMGQSHGPVSVEVVAAQSVAIAIVDVARRRHADLIAMSTLGLGTMSRLLVGSVADEVARTAPVPTLLFRSHPR